MLKSRQMAVCLAILLSACLVQIIAAIAMRGQPALWAAILAAAVNALLCGILYYVETKHIRINHVREFLKKGKNPQKAICSIIRLLGMGITLCIVVTYILSFVESIMPTWFKNYNEMIGEFDFSVLPWVLYSLLLAPLSEELIFRGAILSAAEKGFRFRYANLIQAVLFGVYHMNLIQGLYAFAIGLVFALAKKKTRSILAAVLVHISFNSTTYILSMLLPEGGYPPPGVSIVLFSGSLAVGLALLRYYIKRPLTTDEIRNE